MVKYVCIGIAVVLVVFLFFVFCVNYDRIIAYLKNKKPKITTVKETSKKEKKPEKIETEFVPKPGEKQAEIQDTVYDFEDFNTKVQKEELIDEMYDENPFEKFGPIDFKAKQAKGSSKPISKEIKKLSPKLKVMLIDNALKRRDDI